MMTVSDGFLRLQVWNFAGTVQSYRQRLLVLRIPYYTAGKCQHTRKDFLYTVITVLSLR